jgi:hypothetical protein
VAILVCTRCIIYVYLTDLRHAEGGIVYSVVFRNLQPKIGFGWTTRVIALIMLITLTLPSTCLKMRLKPAVARRFFDPKPWTETPFVVFAVSCLFGLIGLYIPYFYVDSFARDRELVNAQLVPYLLSIMNAGSFVGRLVSCLFISICAEQYTDTQPYQILCYIADRTGPVTILILCALGSAIAAFAWVGVSSQAGMIVFCVFYGCFSGTYLSLVMTTVAAVLCPDMSVLGMRIGMACIPCATGLLIGSPIGGATVKQGLLGLQLLTGVALSISLTGMVGLRVLKVGWRFLTRC